ncbi:inorganic phosphate transporter [Carboxylicivirga sp. A043]|uniref:inorganic phosphate transporter n=1 Tax=Carboxylicivirga litoralis TaxID=2816963 RepID=UPI0021CB19A4|nr:inorganic phosphate transporter [Carboxylicivirga sp. A043]MCU4155326.1 inorganic phosphate transporter [Carboxylicivirga sp. A043]
MTFIWIAVILLGVLAVVDLVVGVSNDAVNFLNAAIGSRAARRKLVYWVAAIGLLIGSMLSVNMMEVARKGVIYPSSFTFIEIIVVFVAVMLVDIILIDGFNTLGFPTSTTIAIVFELLGGAMALSIIKNREARIDGLEIDQMINTDKAFIILAGILLSIFLAFVVGIVVQFVTRVIFSFNYHRRFKYLFALVGGFAITAIVFMIFKKGMGDTSIFHSYAWFEPVVRLQAEILFGVFALSTFVFLFLGLSFNVDIPRVVVLFGTFALAMSFAANDLVNFIGIPLTAVESFKTFLASGSLAPDEFSMGFISNNVIRKDVFSDYVYTIIFTLSAVVMTITLFKSKKARSVTETEVYLGRQSSGYERFEPSYLSRVVVRNFLHIHSLAVGILPKKVVNFFDRRYKKAENVEGATVDGVIYFDTVRASVNLVVASILISLGTYMRFPLSTTFVVFMVAMGTSLADQAWGRESAVYRVSGVLSILGGWFFTACMAFIGAFIFTYLIWYGSWVATILLAGTVVTTLILTKKYHSRKQEEKRMLKEEFQDEIDNNLDHLKESGSEQIRRHLQEASKVFYLSLQGFIDEDIRQLHEAHNKAQLLDKYTRSSKSKFFYAYARVTEEGIDSGHYFVQAFDYLTELVGCLTNITQPLFEHIENQHKGMTKSQRNDLQELLEEMSGYFNHIIHVEKEQKFELVNEMISKQNFLISFQDSIRRNQIKRIQKGEGRTRVSILFMDVLAETKNVLLYSINCLKAHRDFIISSRSNN